MGDCLRGNYRYLCTIAGTPDRHGVGSYKKSRQVHLMLGRDLAISGDNAGLVPLDTPFYVPGIAGHLLFWTGLK